MVGSEAELLAIANHPFGGAAGIAAGKALLNRLASAPETPTTLRVKLIPMIDALLADVLLNTITHDTVWCRWWCPRCCGWTIATRTSQRWNTVASGMEELAGCVQP